MVTIVTLYDSAMADVGKRTGARIREYAEAHGYDYRVFTDILDESRHASWSKVLALKMVLSSTNCEWVMWLDADAYIANTRIEVSSLIVGGKDVLFASDGNGLCAGVILLRRCRWTLSFLDSLWLLGDVERDVDGFGRKWEQNTIKVLLANFPLLRGHIGIVAQSRLNSYLNTYKNGDFILHMVGMDNKTRLEVISRLETERKPIPISN